MEIRNLAIVVGAFITAWLTAVAAILCASSPSAAEPLKGVVDKADQVEMNTHVSAPEPNEKFPVTDGGMLPLQGAAQHSDYLPPVPQELRPGMKFNENSLPALDTDQGWCWIPAWAAGKFRRHFTTSETQVGGASIKSISIDFVTDSEPTGWQTDKSGGIWDYIHVPYVERHHGGMYAEYKLITRKEVIKSTPDVLITRCWCSSIRVDKLFHRIVAVYQQDEIDTISRRPKGCKQQSSVKWFDANGYPQQAISSNDFSSNETRVEDYKPVDSYNNRDMKQNFKTFLISHGLENLVPDSLR